MSIRQINILIFIFFIAVFYFSVTILYKELSFSFQKDFKSDIKSTLNDIKYIIQKDDIAKNSQYIGYIEQKLKNTKYINAIYIIDLHTQGVLYSYKNKKFIQKPAVDTLHIEKIDLEDDVYYKSEIKYTVQNSYNSGLLLADFDEKLYLENNIKYLKKIIFVSVLFPIFILITFWLFTQKFLLKPISDIERFIGKREPIDNRFWIDELESLRVYSKRSFNNLETLNKSLEDEISKKTKDLVYSEKKLRTLVDNINEAVIVLEKVDEDYRIVDFNQFAQKLEGVTKDDTIGASISVAFPMMEEYGLVDEIRKVYTTEESSHYLLSFCKDGGISGWRDNYIYKLSTGQIVIIYSDITQQKQYEESLRSLNTKLREKMEIINNNVLISTTDKDGVITDVSEAFCKISGFTKEELVGKSHNIIRDPDVKSEVFKELWRSISSGKTWMGELKNRDKNQDKFWVNMKIYPRFDKNRSIIGYTAVMHDITDRKRVEKLSITDEMTSLYNRRYFNEVFHREIKRAKREGHYLSLAILDIDNFKKYNDSYGHQMGDEALMRVGAMIRKYLKRGSDFGFRLGGEEFGIIFCDQDSDESMKFLDRIRDAIEALNIEHINNEKYNKLTTSIGFVTCKDDVLDVKEFYNIADDALYKAKKGGRNRVVKYDCRFK
jgi:diguanylate cyclase (GGDEF)-like protein/PAS domain S-box-containing protein